MQPLLWHVTKTIKFSFLFFKVFLCKLYFINFWSERSFSSKIWPLGQLFKTSIFSGTRATVRISRPTWRIKNKFSFYKQFLKSQKLGYENLIDWFLFQACLWKDLCAKTSLLCTLPKSAETYLRLKSTHPGNNTNNRCWQQQHRQQQQHLRCKKWKSYQMGSLKLKVKHT